MDKKILSFDDYLAENKLIRTIGKAHIAALSLKDIIKNIFSDDKIDVSKYNKYRNLILDINLFISKVNKKFKGALNYPEVDKSEVKKLSNEIKELYKETYDRNLIIDIQRCIDGLTEMSSKVKKEGVDKALSFLNKFSESLK